MYANGVFVASNAYFKGFLVGFSVVCSYRGNTTTA